MIKELEKQAEGSLGLISIDETALKACRDNNKAKTTDENAEPEVGGNGQKYKELLGA